MTKYGIIDLSSSTISLYIAKAEADSIETVSRERKGVSSLDYMDDKGNLSKRGIQKAIQALSGLEDIARSHGVTHLYAISTASLRRMKNYREVGKAIADATGLHISRLDGKTEAFADYIANERYRILDRGVLVDIGGASTEICDLRKGKKEDMRSLPLGALSLRHDFASRIYPSKKEAKAMKHFIRGKLEGASLPEKGRFENAVLVGSNTQALYAIYADRYDITAENGEKIIQYDKLKALCRHLVKSPERSLLIIKNAPEKVHVIIPTAILAKEILRRFGIATIIISDLGVKEGYLKLLLSGAEQATPLVFRSAPREE